MTIKPELSCLALDSRRWHDLDHAYGKAADIPDLLRQLAGLPSSTEKGEPWFPLWSALAHQGDVYSASFAAVPHVVRALATAPARADAGYFQFPAWIEICRRRHGITVPPDQQADYAAALAALPGLAAAKGLADVAEAVLALTPEVAADFLEWQENR